MYIAVMLMLLMLLVSFGVSDYLIFRRDRATNKYKSVMDEIIRYNLIHSRFLSQYYTSEDLGLDWLFKSDTTV